MEYPDNLKYSVEHEWLATDGTVGFTAFNGQVDALRAAGVRIFGPGATVAQDLEPEYVTVSADSRTAYVTLQEANGLAVVDLSSGTVDKVVGLGAKDFAVAGQRIDPKNDGSIGLVSVHAKGLYMPDGIATYSRGGQTFLVMANEGDFREDDADRSAASSVRWATEKKCTTVQMTRMAMLAYSPCSGLSGVLKNRM